MSKYVVYVDDNFHYMDESYRYKLGEFKTCKEAVKACKKIVDEFFEDYKDEKKSSKELYGLYTMFGEDPYIITDDEKCKFSARDYAREVYGKFSSQEE